MDTRENLSIHLLMHLPLCSEPASTSTEMNANSRCRTYGLGENRYLLASFHGKLRSRDAIRSGRDHAAAPRRNAVSAEVISPMTHARPGDIGAMYTSTHWRLKGHKAKLGCSAEFPSAVRGRCARPTGMYVLCVRADTPASCCPLTILHLPEHHFHPKETLLIIKTRISTLYTPEINHSCPLTKIQLKVACLWKINCYGSVKEINNLRIFIHSLTQVESPLQPFSPIIKRLLDLA